MARSVTIARSATRIAPPTSIAVVPLGEAVDDVAAERRRRRRAPPSVAVATTCDRRRPDARPGSPAAPSGSSTRRRIWRSRMPMPAAGLDDVAVDALEPDIGVGQDRRDREQDHERGERVREARSRSAGRRRGAARRTGRPGRGCRRSTAAPAPRPVWPMNRPTGSAIRAADEHGQAGEARRARAAGSGSRSGPVQWAGIQPNHADDLHQPAARRRDHGVRSRWTNHEPEVEDDREHDRSRQADVDHRREVAQVEARAASAGPGRPRR